MTFRLGLTGSIGMGKSTTAAMFADEGCEVWDADAAVHRAYAAGGAAVEPIGALFPEALEGGEVSRDALRRRIAEDPDALARVEAIVHPIVAEDRRRAARKTQADIIVFDIPLLFETGADAMMDATVCVTVDEETQRRRVLSRPGMTDAQFEAILSKQMPSTEKEARADHVVVTDTPEHARAQVRAIVAEIREKLADA
ncbi:dephospho-CoA kinase [Rhodosalinus sp. FB01]|uniref:dephospho-CoA kinase n=1 Tax=Rhodosalinus sp. FB01 TaxID=3239194 RepID=UPI0035251D0F